jgi:hypothetical protein
MRDMWLSTMLLMAESNEPMTARLRLAWTIGAAAEPWLRAEFATRHAQA